MVKAVAASIILFLFSTMTCRKVPGVCAAFAVAAASSLVATSIAEATAFIVDKTIGKSAVENEVDERVDEFFWAPTNGKYGDEEQAKNGDEQVEGEAESERGGRTLEVPLIRHETEEAVEIGDFTTGLGFSTYFL